MRYINSHYITLRRRPYKMLLFSIYCLPYLRSARRHSGRPSNVYQSFGHRYHYVKEPWHLPQPFPNIHRGQKVRNLASIFDYPRRHSN